MRQTVPLDGAIWSTYYSFDKLEVKFSNGSYNMAQLDTSNVNYTI